MKKINFVKLNKSLLTINIVVALIYFSWWLNPNHIGNPILYSLLLLGEIYHLFMALSFWFTLWPGDLKVKKLKRNDLNLLVDVFITVAGEPVEIVRQTVEAAKNIDYSNYNIYILNDGYVAKKDNWQEIENLATDLEVNCITRRIPGGAKAGNINNALKQTKGEIVVVLDADMVPKVNFLKKIIPYFIDESVGFIQTPQYYKNWETNEISAGAWEQQELFFGPIMKGKEKSNASFICGTNFGIRRKALEEVGGISENSIAEDFYTSLLVHQKGWKSYYINEVLVEGLAPEDLLSYYKQQLRWARGSLQILFDKNPLLIKNLTWPQRIEYLASSMYYFNGIIVLIDIIMPLIFLFFGIRPVAASSTSFSLFFLPFMFLVLYTLRLATSERISFRALSLSHSSFYLQIKALVSIIFKEKMGFSVTSKKQLNGNYAYLAYPQLIYLILAIVGTILGVGREGLNPSVITNVAWVMVNSALFLPFIGAAIKPRLIYEEFRFNWNT